jgi:hypothetical protein
VGLGVTVGIRVRVSLGLWVGVKVWATAFVVIKICVAVGVRVKVELCFGICVVAGVADGVGVIVIKKGSPPWLPQADRKTQKIRSQNGNDFFMLNSS